MTNHVHLIVEANERLGDIGLLMKRLAGRQTRFVNKMEIVPARCGVFDCFQGGWPATSR